MKKIVKIIIISVCILSVLTIIAGIVAGNFFYNIALNPNSDKSAIFGPGNGDDISPELKDQIEKNNKDRDEWLETVTLTDVSITSFDNLKLHGTEIVTNTLSNKWAILCHGYTGSSNEMQYPAMRYYKMDFNIIMPDARGHGKSEGEYIGMGWDERKDITKWIDKIVAKDSNAQIMLYGISMGGATVMMTSGEILPSNVKVIVEDCGYTSVWDEFAYQLKTLFKLPAFPIMHFASMVAKIRAGYWLGDASAIQQVAKSVTPMLFIHGEKDSFVPYFMLDEVYTAAKVEKEKYVVEGAGHGMAYLIAGESYWTTVTNFISKYII